MDEDAYRATRDDPAAVDRLWRDLATERLERWIDVAEERAAGRRASSATSTGGNDDLLEVMTALPTTGTRSFVGCEGGPCHSTTGTR